MSALQKLVGAVLSRAQVALTYTPQPSFLSKAHVGAKLGALAALWVGLLSVGVPHSLPLLALVAAMALSSPRPLARGSLVLSLIPTVFVGVASMVLTPHEPLSPQWALRSLTLSTRTLGLALASLLVMGTTSPLALAGLVARSPRAHDLLVVFYRSLPLTVGDVAESLSAQALLGKPVHHTLVPTTLLAVRRAEGLALSLYTRGYRLAPRARVEPLGSRVHGLVLLAASLAALAASLALEGLGG